MCISVKNVQHNLELDLDLICLFLRCKQWIHFTRRADIETEPLDLVYKINKNNLLCSEHFEECFFSKTAKKRLRLVNDALPTIFNIPNPPPKLMSSRPAPKERQQFVASTSASTSVSFQEPICPN